MFSISILQFFNFSILPKRRFAVHPTLHFLKVFGNPEYALRGEGENVQAVIILVAAQVVFGAVDVTIIVVALYDIIHVVKDISVKRTIAIINAYDDRDVVIGIGMFRMPVHIVVGQ
jgi:hypothetical protein